MKTYDISLVNEVFDFFDFTKPHWPYNDGLSYYIFRGQGNSNWKLIPSAFRKTKKGHTCREQTDFEFDLMHRFYKEIIHQGLWHPDIGVSQSLDFGKNLDYLNKIGSGEIVWPSREYYEVIALAQHYGLPTRFLDFSLSPYVALYFSAYDNYTSKCENDFAIFITSTSHQEISEIGSWDRSTKKLERYQLVQSPTIFNENIKAQKGLFLGYFDDGYQKNRIFNPISLEDYLGEKIYKVVVKKDLAFEILMRLSMLDFDARSLFPGINGVVKHIKEDLKYFSYEKYKSTKTWDLNIDKYFEKDAF